MRNILKRKLSLSKQLEYRIGKGNSNKKIAVILSAITLTASLAGIAIYHGHTATAKNSAKVLGAFTGNIAGEPYTIEAGETIFSVGEKTHKDWQTIAKLNQLPPPFVLQAGQTILLPTE